MDELDQLIQDPNNAAMLGRDSLAAYAVAVRPDYQIACHLDIIIQALEKVEQGEWKRLLIEAPPRHGKSLSVSTIFPAWFQGKHPESKVMMCCHTQSLASEFGYEMRELILSEEHQAIFPEHQISDASKGKSNWTTTAGGKFFAAGIQGGSTGRGADCLTGDTVIKTSVGDMRIDRLVQLQWYPKVLAYCHQQQKPVWRSVIAKREIPSDSQLEITTVSGNRIKCTDKHRLYCHDRGYVEARTLKPGDVLYSINPDFDLQLLPEIVPEAKVRNSKSGQARACGLLLWETVFGKPSRYQESPPVRNMQITGVGQNPSFLRQLQISEERRNLIITASIQ